jgi:hypothetical protein
VDIHVKCHHQQRHDDNAATQTGERAEQSGYKRS